MASSTIVRAVITPAGKAPILRSFTLTTDSTQQRHIVCEAINNPAFLYAEQNEDGVALPVEAITSLTFENELSRVNNRFYMPESIFRAMKELHEAFVAHLEDGDAIQAFVCVE